MKKLCGTLEVLKNTRITQVVCKKITESQSILWFQHLSIPTFVGRDIQRSSNPIPLPKQDDPG